MASTLAEQSRIVAEIDRRLSLVRMTEAEIDISLRRAEVTRQSILAAAFSGTARRETMADRQTVSA